MLANIYLLGIVAGLRGRIYRGKIRCSKYETTIVLALNRNYFYTVLGTVYFINNSSGL